MPGKNDNKSFQLKKGMLGKERYKVLKFYKQLLVGRLVVQKHCTS